MGYYQNDRFARATYLVPDGEGDSAATHETRRLDDLLVNLYDRQRSGRVHGGAVRLVLADGTVVQPIDVQQIFKAFEQIEARV